MDTKEKILVLMIKHMPAGLEKMDEALMYFDAGVAWAQNQVRLATQNTKEEVVVEDKPVEIVDLGYEEDEKPMAVDVETGEKIHRPHW